MKKRIDNDKKKMLYFSMLCLIFVIALTTGTYAYFTASRTVENIITGETATVSFGLGVIKVTNIDHIGLIPMDDEAAPFAAKNSCQDDLGSAVCQIYEITLINTGNTAMYLDGYITLNVREIETNDEEETETESEEEAKSKNEMRFTRVYYDGDTFCTTQPCTDDFDISNVKTGIAKTTEGSYNRTDDYQALFISDEFLKPEEEKKLYVMVWLHNELKSQDELQGVENFFYGSANFVSSEGNEVTADFS